ncbi:MAG TPA: cellulose biosynthesis protein BcsS [Xanthobacteraceae bacterium]|nr:cellulose biosynthesis protein BcsS [Xanthobacteraceae bacterium]
MARRLAEAVALLATAVWSVAYADELTSPVASRAFLFGGADLTQNSAFTWSGVTSIPFAKIGEDGFRVRAMGGIGRYEYRTSAVAGGKNNGTIASGELLFGNRTSFGATVLTGYIGLDAKNYVLDNPDPKNPESGSRAGIKAAVEIYTRTAPDWFFTGYANISSVFQSYSLRGAVHHEFKPGLALGAEGGVLGDERYDEERLGLIATIVFSNKNVTAAAGVAHSEDNGSGGYTTLTLYAPF